MTVPITSWIAYGFVGLCVGFTVYGQVVVKWQVGSAGPFPNDMMERITFVFRLLVNPWVISGLAAAFLAFLCWIVAITRLPLSHAYPVTALSFVLVLFLSALVFHEPLTATKLVGTAMVVLGVAIGSQQ